MIKDAYKIAVIDSLILSECYLEHFNEYKYIAVLDPDEVILTKKLATNLDTSEAIHYVKSVDYSNETQAYAFIKEKCNRYEHTTENAKKLDAYLGELHSKKKQFSTDTNSFYFTQAFYLKNALVEQIFQVFEATLKNVTEFSFVDNNEIRMPVHFEDEGDFTVKHKTYRIAYLFTISNQHEFEYARNLLALYVQEIRPYLTTSATNFARYVKDFDRFFFIAGKINDFSWGKSVHNTRHTLDFTVHHANKYITGDTKLPVEVDWNFLNAEYAKYYRVPYKLAYVSHFRSFFPNSRSKIPVSFLHLDFNYLNCYFVPIVEKISKNKKI